MATAGARRGSQNRKIPFKGPKLLKRKREEDELENLSRRVAEIDSHSSSPPEYFKDLPLSTVTQSGLTASKFKNLTTIQSRAIPAALKGADILGAAKTGSGKTLAFLVPVLENLYRKRWTEYDGLGALILSPTRELAIQIFEVLRKVGRKHTFSAGLVIGGKSLQEESDRLGRMNILVATPGRILQHMDQTAMFEVGNLQILVLDEADRIMDMGFQSTLDAIIEHIPQERQTLMFSATQTKRVSDLARLSLKDPEFVSVHEASDTATPSSLQQSYVITPLPEKLDILWSFIRANVKKKIIVFLSSGKQVRFLYESFRHLQPGIPLLHLHGRQKQNARLDITERFSKSDNVCLFSTDVAARGLDFPAVDWVVQVDCPEDADTYIHRVGRTARYESNGQAVIFLDPSEADGMLKALEKKKVFLEKIDVREKKMQTTIRNQLQNMCFKDPELKYIGQKAFASYVRSVHLQKEKDIFHLKQLDLEGYAASLGLPGAPRVKFMKGDDTKSRKNAPRKLLEASDDDEDEHPREQQPAVRTKYDRMFQRANQDVFSEHYTKMIDDSGDDAKVHDDSKASGEVTTGVDDDFLSVKRRFEAGDEALGPSKSTGRFNSNGQNQHDHGNQDSTENHPHTNSSTIKVVQLTSNPDEALTIDSNRREKLLKSKKKLLKYKGHGSHLHFGDDDDSQPYEKGHFEHEDSFARQGRPEEQRARFVAEELDKARTADVEDKEVARLKKRAKRDRAKEREREEQQQRMDLDDHEEGGGGGGRVVQLIPYEGGDDDDEVRSDIAPEPAVNKQKQKKWFEDQDDPGSNSEPAKISKSMGNKRQRRQHSPAEPQTLEDLEAMASGLLARD